MTAETQAPARHLGLALAIISTAQLMVVLDATIVNVALPSIQRGLHFSLQNLVWVTTAYSLTFGGLLLFGGRTGDLFGRRRMFFIGIGVFAVASLLGGFAQTDVWLIITRAAQGAGGAIASPTALALIATNFPEGPARNRAMGVYAAMSGAGAAVGLLAGGVLTDLASWRWVLFVNVPIAAVVLLVGPGVLRESETRGGRLDVPGAITVTAGMGLLVYGLTNAASHSWTSTTTLACLISAAVLLVVFVLFEARSRHALMPLQIFANRNRSGAYLMMLFIGAAIFGMFYFLTQYLQNILGYSPLKAGLAFLPVALTIGVCSQVAARLVGRIGVRGPLLVGPVAAIAGLVWLSQLTSTSGYLSVLGPILCIGLGMGFSFVPLTLTAVSGVQRSDSGLASALLNTGQQIGGAIGLALLSTVSVEAIRSRTGQLAASHGGHLTVALQHQAVVHGYDRGFMVATGIACLALLVSVIVIRVDRLSPEGDPAEVATVAVAA
ncbi:MAG TPA: MFS transporter [Acidimicrobiales bacterium]|jgi:EmrB/QacA subfamily drug resistance transporter